jgi:lipopolysaccharide transport system ATP-binding protein
VSAPYAIQAVGLGKQYVLGRASAGSVRDVLDRSASALLRVLRRRPRPSRERTGRDGGTGQGSAAFWALRDVSFAVREGEVLGIIGSNGAGKSTLLKILSLITRPTTGWAEVHGRCASLLEVGTGFHPELSGRENIFVNGAILGMTRAEVRRKLDDIIAFAGVEQFLDTPVKRYSSGMYVRLAFSVAAHLQPDILVIDEVLAVGDVAFQQKCLGRMRDVSKSGRTVLFVSHNMPVVKGLCSRAILLDRGRLVMDGPAEEVVDRYMLRHVQGHSTCLVPDDWPRVGNGLARIRSVNQVDTQGEPSSEVFYGDPVRVRFEFDVLSEIRDGVFEVSFYNLDGLHLVCCQSPDAGVPAVRLRPGRYAIEANLDVRLLPNQYTIAVGIHHENGPTIDYVERTLSSTVLRISREKGGHYKWSLVRGHVGCPSSWSVPRKLDPVDGEEIKRFSP